MHALLTTHRARALVEILADVFPRRFSGKQRGRREA